MDLQGKRVVVVGLGKSGVAAAKLCARRGANVTAFDHNPAAPISPEAAKLSEHGVTVVQTDGLEDALSDAERIVVSPGVPFLPEFGRAEARGVPVVGELEFSLQALVSPAPTVCVGGTNGKSTTTSLVGALLSTRYPNVFVGGNLGTPLADHADDRFDVIVLEVSSFQLERSTTLKPSVAVLLNITPDHLDRYPDFEAYADAKGNVFALQEPTDLAVVPVDDNLCAYQARRGRGTVITFGRGADVHVSRSAIIDQKTGFAYSRNRLRLHGDHNALNVAAAVAAVRPFDVPRASMEDALERFEALPHRTAFVAKIGEVSYYDDSKGTNVGAAVMALRGLRENKGVLIAGGRGKGGSYAALVRALAVKGRAAVVIGEEARAIANAIGGVVPVRRAASMKEAVHVAAELAQPGDAVLLSPGCSSFDMFDDYNDRGNRFIQAVRTLAKEQAR